MEPTALGIDVNAIIVNVLLSVVTLVITAVGGFLASFLKSKLNANQLDLLDNIAANVVLAVEQSTYGTAIANDANAKKEQAYTMLGEYLKKYSITLTPDQINATIESAVGAVLNSNKLIEPPKDVTFVGPNDDGFAQ